MKVYAFLFLFCCLLGEALCYKSGREIYFNVTLDFASIPGTPGTQTILAPGGPRNFVINWNAMRYDAMVTPQMTKGLCSVGGFGDWATYNNNGQEVNYFLFGNGVNVDYIMHGPFWCDSSAPIPYWVDNTTIETYLKYDSLSNQDNNPLYGFIAPYWSNQLDIFQGLSFHDIQWSGAAGIDPSIFWQLWDTFGSAGSSLVVNPSMDIDLSIGQVIYGPLNPLVVQFVTPNVAVDGSSTGSITFRIPVTFLD